MGGISAAFIHAKPLVLLTGCANPHVPFWICIHTPPLRPTSLCSAPPSPALRCPQPISAMDPTGGGSREVPTPPPGTAPSHLVGRCSRALLPRWGEAGKSLHRPGCARGTKQSPLIGNWHFPSPGPTQSGALWGWSIPITSHTCTPNPASALTVLCPAPAVLHLHPPRGFCCCIPCPAP